MAVMSSNADWRRQFEAAPDSPERLVAVELLTEFRVRKMAKPLLGLCLCAFFVLALEGSALAQSRACRVDHFRGAMSPEGTVAHMRVSNGAGACGITTYGVPDERGHPVDSGKITKQPAHGNAEFVAPRASYTPEPGYVGEDEFEYEAFARDRIGHQVRLKVQVQVVVAAPRD